MSYGRGSPNRGDREHRGHDARGVKRYAQHNAVDAVVQSADLCYLRVRPYGNCTLFNSLVEDDNLRMGNVATEGKGDWLRVHVAETRSASAAQSEGSGSDDVTEL